MDTPATPRRWTTAFTLAVSAALAGCAGMPTPRSLDEVRAQSNPADRTQRSITNFTPALRCMDELMFRVGTRDITLMMEELRDSTQRVPVSARDMMTSAISDMTRRSRAVRLSVFGQDQAHLLQLLQQAQKNEVFTVVPQFNLRGSISQIDEDVQRTSSSLGAVAARFGLRLGQETRYSVLGFDAAMVDTETLTLVPGVASKNTTVITRRDTSAGDGQAQLIGVGAVFSFAAARSEGTAQAARNMVELAAVELVGKLARLPYWQCLGLPDTHPEVRRELEDWFMAMGPDERVRFQQERLREQRYYDGPTDGRESVALRRALAAVQAAAGPQAPQADPHSPAWFRHLVTQPLPRADLPAMASAEGSAFALASTGGAVGVAPPSGRAGVGPGTAAAQGPAAPGRLAVGHEQALRSIRTSVPSSARTGPPASATPRGAAAPAAPLTVELRTDGQGQLRLDVQATVAGYVYCYAVETASGKIRRIFPNRYARDPAISAGQALNLPGTTAFRLPRQHDYACVHAPREVYAELPAPLRWGDFEVIRLSDLESVREAFATAAGQPVALIRAATAVARR